MKCHYCTKSANGTVDSTIEGADRLACCNDCVDGDTSFQSFAEPVPASSTQVGGDHYKKQPIQPWDYIAANGIGYFEGNVIKYVSRWKDKNGVEDLKKARHYLDKLIETTEESK